MIFNQRYYSSHKNKNKHPMLEIVTNDCSDIADGTIRFVLKDNTNYPMRSTPDIPVAMLFMIMDVIDTSLKVYGKQLESTLKRMEEENQNGKED